MLPYFTQYYGNTASRIHSYGWQADAAVQQAREQVAGLIGAQPHEIVFTSGATEACNLALRGILEMYATKGNHIITTKVEHKAVLDTCKTLQKKGVAVTYISVNEDGIINTAELEAAIRPNTVLAAVMLANNETGVVMPAQEIGRICKKHGVLFFCDATQAVGKIPVNVNDILADLMAFSSHKIYGPKGVGALYVRSRNPRVKITPQITGGGHENNIRSGTLNVPGIVGFGKACALCRQYMDEESNRLQLLTQKLVQVILQIPHTFLNGSETHRLPHVANISFAYLNSSQILSMLNKRIAVSAGSACTSGTLDPSYVLKAMHIPDALAKSAIRFSAGRFTTNDDIDTAISAVKNVVEKLRAESFEWQTRDDNNTAL